MYREAERATHYFSTQGCSLGSIVDPAAADRGANIDMLIVADVCGWLRRYVQRESWSVKDDDRCMNETILRWAKSRRVSHVTRALIAPTRVSSPRPCLQVYRQCNMRTSHSSVRTDLKVVLHVQPVSGCGVSLEQLQCFYCRLQDLSRLLPSYSLQ